MIRPFLGVLLRSFKLLYRKPIDIVLALIAPALGLLVFWLVFSQQQTPDQRAAYLSFLLPGLVGFLSLAQLGQAHSAFESDVQSGVLKMQIVSRAPLPVVVFGKFAAGMVHMLIQGAALTVIAVVAMGCSIDTRPTALLRAVGACFAAGAAFHAIGFLLAVHLRIRVLSNLIMTFGTTVLAVASTAYLSIERMPTGFQFVARWNPLSHCCNALRAAMTGGAVDLWWSGMQTLVPLAVVGLLATAASSQRVERLVS